MAKQLIWDVPTRVFHWAFSACLSLALLIAFLADDDNPLFRWHMLFGLAAAMLLPVRIVVAVAGGRHARLRALLFNPAETAGYLARAPFGKARRYAGHNPGSALAALCMFLLVAGLAWSGASIGIRESPEDLHAALAYGLLAAILAHMAGLLLHALHHKENIGFSMFSGRKAAEAGDAIPSARPAAGLLTLALVTWCILTPFRAYDPSTATVALPGLGVVHLGEQEAAGDADEGGDDERGRDHDD